MDSTTFAAARDALIAARRGTRAIERLAPDRRPSDLGEAYRLQNAVAEGLGRVGGWKISAVTDEQRRALGVDVPLGAPLMSAWMHDASARPPEFRVADFIVPKLECEFAFEFARDLPPRIGKPYSRAEVESAIAALRIGVEIVDSRLPRGLGALAELADAFNNGGFVAGPSIRDWHRLDFPNLGIVLTVTRGGATSELARGSGRAILDGDPFGTVVLLANAQPPGSGGLRAGQIVTTGSCTGAPFLPGPGAYQAEFTGLGNVEFSFVA
ncbi:MAG: hypothetical protein ABJA61_03760 [Caldimonas sp.]